MLNHYTRAGKAKDQIYKAKSVRGVDILDGTKFRKIVQEKKPEAVFIGIYWSGFFTKILVNMKAQTGL